MPTLDDRLLFAKRHITNKEGRPFSLTGREWVAEEFWLAADGFKWWPVDQNALCDDCRLTANTLTEWTHENPTVGAEHAATGCKGLKLEPIVATVLKLPRREGKTFNAAAFNIATISLCAHKSITYVAAAEDQTETLFEENYKMPIVSSPVLSKHLKVMRTNVTCAKTKSFFEIVPTSHSSITGRGRSHIVIDEARDVPARVTAALIPSVFANNGIECPKGCISVPNSADPPQRCSVCNSRMRPWFGRMIFMSSAGVLEGGEKDWFAELVNKLLATPDPNYHVYALDESTNPDVSQGTRNAVDRVFGQLDSMRTYMDVELHNQARRKGEDFVSVAQINACTDRSLVNLEGDERPCVGFLDTSWSGDITSLVLLTEDDGCEFPWQRVFVSRLDKWKPQRLVGGHIDPAQVQALLDRVVPLYPRLRKLAVDTRVGMQWARDLVSYNHRERPAWGKKIIGINWGQDERSTGWQMFEERILSRRIRIPFDKDLDAELKGVQRVARPNGEVEIRDRSRKKRHADIAEGLASACYLVYREQTKPSLSLADTEGRRSNVLARMPRPLAAGFRPDGF